MEDETSTSTDGDVAVSKPRSVAAVDVHAAPVDNVPTANEPAVDRPLANAPAVNSPLINPPAERSPNSTSSPDATTRSSCRPLAKKNLTVQIIDAGTSCSVTNLETTKLAKVGLSIGQIVSCRSLLFSSLKPMSNFFLTQKNVTKQPSYTLK